MLIDPANTIDGQFLDSEKRRDLHVQFAGNLEPRTILNHLELVTSRIVSGKTLLFFDEIQACPRAITALRYFYEQIHELHVVAVGSLNILSELRSYFFVGGMPESVKTWRDSGSVIETFQVQSEILESYSDDFSKYKPRIDTLVLMRFF